MLSPYRGFDVRVQHLEPLAVYSSAEDIPQLKRRLGHNLYGIAAIPTDKQTSVVCQDFIFELRENVVHQVPVIIAVADHGEVLVRINLRQQAPDVCNLIAIHGEVGTHHTMLSGQGAIGNWLLGTVTVIVVLQPENGWDSGCIQEAEAEE